MAGASDIEWTDATWNPISGCKIASPGCTNCYAMRMAARLQAMDHPAYFGVTRVSGGRPKWTGAIHTNDAALELPLRWRAPRKVFVNSMSDLFQDGVPNAFVERIWGVMAQARQHIFQILTKRPENMRRVIASAKLGTLPNVWLGVSVESSAYRHRILELRGIPAAVRFVSFEPLIGGIGRVNLEGVHWAIVGGESGPSARPMKECWVDNVANECERQGVAFFFKQWGGVQKKKAGRMYRNRIWDAYPNTTAA